MSAHRAFHWAYGGDVTAGKIAHFLILNPQSPRSLITCVQSANAHLERLARGYGHSTVAQSWSRKLLGELTDLRVEDIFDEGLHEFLTRFIREIAGLGSMVHEVYLSGDVR